MFADRVKNVTPFLVMEIMEKANEMMRAGENIIHLEVGEPDFDTPTCISAANQIALQAGHTHYTHSLGDLELRQAISQHFQKKYKLKINPQRILTFSGSSPALMLACSAILNPGDEVILSNPCYACYASFIGFAGGIPKYVLTEENDGFQYRPEAVQAALSPNTKAIMINSPCNPTGIILEPQRMQALADLTSDKTIIISDEIYHGLVYSNEPEHSILEFTENAIVIGGFSKTYAMTGWRLGYAIVPEHMVRPLQILMQNFFISPNAAVQKAGITALTQCDQEVENMRQTYDQRRKFLLQGLQDIGFQIPVEPKGAFYVLVNARHLGQDSLKLAFDILDKVKVGVTPGIDFGTQAEGFIRLSYANSIENLAEGLARLKTYIQSK